MQLNISEGRRSVVYAKLPANIGDEDNHSEYVLACQYRKEENLYGLLSGTFGCLVTFDTEGVSHPALPEILKKRRAAYVSCSIK